MYIRTQGMLVRVDHIPKELTKEEQKKWTQSLYKLIESAKEVTKYEAR